MRRIAPTLVCTLALVWPAAGETQPAVPAATDAAAIDFGELDGFDHDLMADGGYLQGHPDQYYQRMGYEALKSGRLAQAREYFLRAARYADKLSQGAYAEMLWNAEGGTADRALAYAWMDLAAERGTPLLVASRERYWAGLSPLERERALREGRAVFAEFGDVVAKPRLEREMRRTLKKALGSRLGARSGSVKMCLQGHRVNATGSGLQIDCMGRTMDSAQYYADKHWKPEQYWRWRDATLKTPVRTGRAKVGELEQLPDAAAPGN